MDTLEKEFKDGCKELLKENISMVDDELKKNPAHLFYRGKRIDFSSVKSLADHWTKVTDGFKSLINNPPGQADFFRSYASVEFLASEDDIGYNPNGGTRIELDEETLSELLCGYSDTHRYLTEEGYVKKTIDVEKEKRPFPEKISVEKFIVLNYLFEVAFDYLIVKNDFKTFMYCDDFQKSVDSCVACGIDKSVAEVKMKSLLMGPQEVDFKFYKNLVDMKCDLVLVDKEKLLETLKKK